MTVLHRPVAFLRHLRRYGEGMKLTDGVYRLGSRFVNFYALEDGGRVTIIDSGIPGYYEQIPGLLRSINRSVSDVEAIVQTHYHSDHIGCTERLRAESGATVFIHEIEAPGLRGDERHKPVKGLGSVIFNSQALQLVGHFIKNGGMKFPKVKEVDTFREGDVLDVPGKLRAVFTPGHSAGHTSLLLESSGVLFAGDALVTRSMKGKTGPRLMETNADPEGAKGALTQLEGIGADLLLPGHGEPWHGNMTEAVALARSTF